MHKQSTNPFTYNNPITNPNCFIGRQREIEQIFSRLLNPEAESSSLVGSRHIGKTSLLMHLAHPDVGRQYGLEIDRFNFVYIDLQVLDRNTTPSQLWYHLIGQMAHQCKDPEPTNLIKQRRESGEIDTFVLEDVFDAIDERDGHIILILDEFDHIVENANFGADFFHNLRSLVIHHNLSLITSGHHDLIELAHSEAIRSSPFFNIFANINLSLFSEEEARQLITTALTETDVSFSDSEIESILSIAGQYPHFLQIACHVLFDAYREQINSNERLKYLEMMFAREAAPHFEFFWNGSSNHEQIMLMALAMIAQKNQYGESLCDLNELNTLYSRSEQTLVSLVKRAFVTEELSEYALFGTAFGEWIVDMLVDSVGNIASYNTWSNPFYKLLRRLRRKNQVADLQNLPEVEVRYRNLIIGWINNTSNPEKVVDLLKNALA